jgi:glycosidase
LHFLKDGFIRPYKKKQLPVFRSDEYRHIISFVPPPMAGLFGYDLLTINKLNHIPLIQFWTDPLSLGRCNDISEIPFWRYFHKKLEHRILSYADRAVFCFPLLCEIEQRLHPEFAIKMMWSDVSYVEHPFDKGKPRNQQITIGLFGAYQRRVRNVQPLLTSFSSFPQVKFIIRGDSDVEINPSDYPNLDIMPGRLPSAEVEQFESQCDILLSLGALAGITPPGKTFYYANYDKPIVYISDGVHKDYFSNYLNGFDDRFITCSNTVESIVTGINKAIAILPKFMLKIPERMDPEAIVRKFLIT